MIRAASLNDISTIVSMVERLHGAASVLVPFDAAASERTLRNLIKSPAGLVIVFDNGGALTGFLAASIGFGATSPLRVAVEHGWWGPGCGSALLERYEAWARENGCHYSSMCSPPGADRVARLLERNGYTHTEITWAKALI